VMERSGAATGTFGPDVRRLALGQARLHEGPGADGVRRVYAFNRIGPPGGATFCVIAAAPTNVLEEPLRAAAVRSLGTWAVAMLVVLIGTGFVAEFMILRRLRAVSRAAARIARGDYAARSGLPPARDELGQFAAAFDQMAASLDQLQRRNQLLLDSIGDGIVGLDREARVVFANPAAASLLGIPIRELTGQPFASLFQRGGPRGDPCMVQQSLTDGQVHLGADDTFTRRDGRSFPAESVTTPVVDSGRIVGAVVALRDATERRRLEEELRQAQKMEAVGQLAGGVAHDFNNLLTAIMTCARMVEEALSPIHPAQADVAEILASANRAAQLTRQLLAFGRRQRLAPRAFDLRESVTGMERMLRRTLGETIALAVSVPPDPVVIVADPSQIEMVVLNLAVNARDAMASGGALSISVSRSEPADRTFAGAEQLPPGALAQIVVSDSGSGMDGETQERIFEPFFTTKPNGKGTGLGLATVYGIVKQTGGTVHVRSAPGKGSEFRVLLPLGAGIPEAVTRAPAPVVGGSERVLVLEDDEVLRSLVCRALAGAGYRVSEAPRPSAAFERALQGDIDLLLADLVLPEESGWSFYRRLAAHRPGLKLLLMSGLSVPADSTTLPRDVPFIPKPFAPRDLLAKVRQAIDGPAPSA
ncbi:MAG TPA: ATP-binding protein, partial [Anaeromyxobacteraceae bacterium]|nr:ATP-binding protein [Anaeromyxobacteraceae bacterium]